MIKFILGVWVIQSYYPDGTVITHGEHIFKSQAQCERIVRQLPESDWSFKCIRIVEDIR